MVCMRSKEGDVETAGPGRYGCDGVDPRRQVWLGVEPRHQAAAGVCRHACGAVPRPRQLRPCPPSLHMVIYSLL